jgi:hypothetical protein
METATSFLIVGPDSKSEVTTDHGWGAVLSSESLVPAVRAEGTGGSDSDLTITSNGSLGTFTFKSDDDHTAFSSSLPSDDFKNTAWVGDSLGC